MAEGKKIKDVGWVEERNPTLQISVIVGFHSVQPNLLALICHLIAYVTYISDGLIHLKSSQPKR